MKYKIRYNLGRRTITSPKTFRKKSAAKRLISINARRIASWKRNKLPKNVRVVRARK